MPAPPSSSLASVAEAAETRWKPAAPPLPGDLRLSELSPLIDQGIDLVPLDPPFSPIAVGPIDVTGGPRVIGAAVDLGAFEAGTGAGNPVAIPTLDRPAAKRRFERLEGRR